MLNSELATQVQAIVDGTVTGEEARAVLQQLDMVLWKARQSEEYIAEVLKIAEESLIYGPGQRRPSYKRSLDEFLAPLRTAVSHTFTCANTGPAEECKCRAATGTTGERDDT